MTGQGTFAVDARVAAVVEEQLPPGVEGEVVDDQRHVELPGRQLGVEVVLQHVGGGQAGVDVARRLVHGVVVVPEGAGVLAVLVGVVLVLAG
jgi:hypothetical protein